MSTSAANQDLACGALGCRRIDDPENLPYAVGGKAPQLRVFANHFLVWRDVNAVDLVLGYVALQPLDLGPKIP